MLVVNTCAFIDSAKQESIDTILEMARHKTDGSCQRLIVTGCMAERYRDELKKEIPEIDAVLGTGEVPEIVGAIGGGGAHAADVLSLRRSPPNPPVPKPRAPARCPTYIYDADTPRLLATPRHYAYVKIAEGCDYKCAFCIIPTLRGAYRSRPADSIVREARALAARGVKELLLISQDTTFYGIDRGERGALARLLRELNAVDGLEWIRLLYLYPTTIDDDTLAAMAECEKVCKYIDLPLQHASNAVLKRMKRPGTRAELRHAARRASATRVPGVALRTTFIVGFPGETEADVDELCGVRRATTRSTTSASSPTRTRKARRPTRSTTTCRRGRRRRGGRGSWACRSGSCGKRQRARIGERVRVMVDGPSPGPRPGPARPGWRPRRRTSTPSVYLTECDPSALPARRLCSTSRSSAPASYDLIGRARAIILDSKALGKDRVGRCPLFLFKGV